MDKTIMKRLQDQFDCLVHQLPETKVEFWFARDLQLALGYTKWEHFKNAINKAISSCETTGCNSNNHFCSVTKNVRLGSGAHREIEDFMLTRYGCYLIAQNGDSRKEPLAFAQCYLALQTRKQELIVTCP